MTPFILTLSETFGMTLKFFIQSGSDDGHVGEVATPASALGVANGK